MKSGSASVNLSQADTQLRFLSGKEQESADLDTSKSHGDQFYRLQRLRGCHACSAIVSHCWSRSAPLDRVALLVATASRHALLPGMDREMDPRTVKEFLENAAGAARMRLMPKSELLRSHNELRGALIVAGKKIRKLSFGPADTPVLKLLRRVVYDARAVAKAEMLSGPKATKSQGITGAALPEPSQFLA